ncbi:uncharacterized protein DUF2512 [Melghirimyces profundicolus]|uniref:Uncharacterized protein DUF2512 n=1 Tax=Melghirimyces profundicolus TaxID=1242148 RepID=A0A2T6BH04_9BACL|nr:DUF2512 family protein [Melghirimyces profundicolus]PTX55332.1 uncharacterized protein DUF2512 [Melghirimyces profundicolus]
MLHGKLLLVKFIATYLSLIIALGWVQNLNWLHLAVVSLVLTVVGYILGEVWILPHVNNTVLTLVDVVLALLVIGFVGNRLYAMDLTLTNLSFFLGAALFIAVVEWIIHAYVQKNVLKRAL